jgi:hypothetical protein
VADECPLTVEKPPAQIAEYWDTVFVLPATNDQALDDTLPTPKTASPPVPVDVLFCPAMILFGLPHTCDAEARDVCRSTEFAPRALPPVAVPSGTASENAPEPFGTTETETFVVAPVA